MMEAQTDTEFWDEIEQRALASAREVRAAMRELNEVYYRAERAKREIAEYYRLRRLQRLARNGD
jgi:hypothetical protein